MLCLEGEGASVMMQASFKKAITSALFCEVLSSKIYGGSVNVV